MKGRPSSQHPTRTPKENSTISSLNHPASVKYLEDDVEDPDFLVKAHPVVDPAVYKIIHGGLFSDLSFKDCLRDSILGLTSQVLVKGDFHV